MEINEIIRRAFCKYRLSGKKSMNTFVFSQFNKYNLTDEQLDKILDTLEKKIAEHEENKRQKAEEEMQKEIEKVILKVV